MSKLALGVTLASLLAVGSAHASEDERQFSVEGNYSYLRSDERNLHGGVLQLSLAWGFSDSWWLYGGAFGGAFGGPFEPMGGAVVGAHYSFDVLKYVPFGRLGLGAVTLRNADQDIKVVPVAEITIGIDRLTSRSRSWGLYVRSQTSFSDYHAVGVGLRLSWRWGFF